MIDDTNLNLELPNFSGPLDLLLHLIKSQKIDIYDIPIAKITSQTLDLKIAGEYFVMASSLLKIKSQYLLPKNDFDNEVIEDDDPREELVEQLVQYSIFKKISEFLDERQKSAPITVAKEPSVASQKKVSLLPFGEISSKQLARAFFVVLQRFQHKNNVGEVNIKEVSIEDMVLWLSSKLHSAHKLSFFELSAELTTVDELISLFLAILELCRNQKIKVYQESDFEDLVIESLVA
ncbi:MAG: segregation/condensation protein A [Lactobacillus iners]|nr:segregation/condensation protein A [Lactobacillus iners]